MIQRPEDRGAPNLFGWNIHQDDDYFLADWVRIFKGLGHSVRDRGTAAGDDDARLD